MSQLLLSLVRYDAVDNEVLPWLSLLDMQNDRYRRIPTQLQTRNRECATAPG